MNTLMIAGGGTGGHVFPMLAVGDAVKQLSPGVEVVYVGTSRGLEARVVPERGDTLEVMNILPLRGGGVLGFARGACRAAASLPEGRALVKRVRPDVVLSVGGYAAGPISLAASTLGVPLALLEPNSALGLSNRLLSPLAQRAYTAFPEVERFLRPSIVVRAGVPLRSRFQPSEYGDEREGKRVRILVLGGSQGSVALNDTVPRAVASALRAGADLEVLHQTGRGREATITALYRAAGAAEYATVVPFIDDVAGALADADIVIGRAGASSLAELAAVGRASILVPYPFAADDHQLKNARAFERAGASICLPQAEADESRIAAELGRLAGDFGARVRMAAACRGLGRADAARAIAEDLLSLASTSKTTGKKKGLF